MTITFYYNKGQGKYGAELYVHGTEKVNLYFTGDMQITYFVRMMKEMYPISIAFHPSITEVTKPYLKQLVAQA
jgi:hypothetical protein